MVSDLGAYHNTTVIRLGAASTRSNYNESAGEMYDAASEVAIELLVAALGDSPDPSEHPDLLERPVSDDVQTLLTLALFRCPELRIYIEKLQES